ncbi:uncharacterized protein GlcG (DUF336 family) [Paenibacillus cellulosilyticus]|uniref:Uncharacterized protein GlcG (DUF336 family) n=1 Tax=Paenibacillus cellulosilyticus TaxID=375489 RepID=A0A2V2YUS5_9BACL|nr:heme-binding protein [Paenibacillus cellulosilyticus]PWW04727.1 uncharacterized protein GlcG (DUF336 family) [Paenibacillus cellulosilyticus]QKS45853.1 heme-binding protein [Paenibacillus cellulosilyticus]
MEGISLQLAIYLLSVAEQRARQQGVPSSIAIVDAGGSLIAFHRMDDAPIAGIDIARNKAWTSVSMQMPTSELARLAAAGGDAFGVNTTSQGKVVILKGGIPLVRGNRIIGGIGVSGGTGDQDIRAAQAAVQALDHYFTRSRRA